MITCGIIPHEQISGDLHQRFSELCNLNTQEILNILTRSLLDHEQDGEPVVLRDEERFSGECLTDGKKKNLSLMKSRW